MSAYYLLPAMFAICVAGAWASYDDVVRRSSWFYPITLLSGIGYGLIWGWAARLLDNKEAMFVYILYWDILMMSAYYVFPLLFAGVRPSVGVLVGCGLVIAGIFVVKFSSPH